MLVEKTKLPGVLILTPCRFGDDRGFFCETYNAATFAEHGIDMVFVQDNQSLSEKSNTVRGLHFQAPPRAQDKLVRCGRGAVYDVAVDIRAGSPTYGEWVGVELSYQNGKQILVPAGFAHGFCTLTEGCELIYKCTDTYAPETEGSFRFDDPDLAVEWPLTGKATLSAKDAEAPDFNSFKSPFTWNIPE